MTTELTLFQIAQEYRHITDVLMDAGADEQTLADTLEGESWDLECKATNYGFVIKNLEANANAILAAMEQMSERAAKIKKRAEQLRNRLKTGMEIAGVQSLTTPYFDIKIKKNPPKVEIWDERQVPAQFWRTPEPPPPPAPAIDKKAIAAAIKANQDVPGAKQVQETRVEIK
jgi:hypothetical protein